MEEYLPVSGFISDLLVAVLFVFFFIIPSVI